MKGLSLFSSAGVGEYYLADAGVDIVCANELLERRAALHRSVYPRCHMVTGDIMNPTVFQEVLEKGSGVDFLIASPPCQGMSVANKFKPAQDPRNSLVLQAVRAIELLRPTFVIIENVPALLKIRLMLKPDSEPKLLVDILRDKFGQDYCIEARVLDAADYGVPQKRLRAIIKLWKKDRSWPWPSKDKERKTVADAIGFLPSLEAGESSQIKWHYARRHTQLQIDAMRHTPTGHSAYENPVFYPKKSDGTRVHGFNTTYRRMEWDKPCPTITMRNDAISSQRNVHPGRPLGDGLYSDARVLTPLELMLCDSLPIDWRIPDDTPELLIRQIIGESIPPLLIKRIVEEIQK